jgi:AraC family transcriptional regulator
LRDPQASVAHVALAVGFQTQAHFSMVFGRLIGEPPSRWRHQQASVI